MCHLHSSVASPQGLCGCHVLVSMYPQHKWHDQQCGSCRNVLLSISDKTSQDASHSPSTLHSSFLFTCTWKLQHHMEEIISCNRLLYYSAKYGNTQKDSRTSIDHNKLVESHNYNYRNRTWSKHCICVRFKLLKSIFQIYVEISA